MASTAPQWLALMETGGNQAFIFDTNRLAEAVGGSFLVAESARQAEVLAAGANVREVLLASGKAAYLFDTEPQARDWLTALGLWAIEHAPGLDLVGVVVSRSPGENVTHTLARAWAELEGSRGGYAGPKNRFHTLPWLRSCDYSGLPALDARNPIAAEHKEGRRVAEPTLSRRQAARQGATALRARLALEGFKTPLAGTLDDLDQAADPAWSWRAIIHADGNGLGRLFLNFDKIAGRLGHTRDDDYLAFASEFSRAVDAATWRAAVETLRALQEQIGDDHALPVCPLLLGGDDFTMVCDGEWALFLASTYLAAFERQTAGSEIIRQVRQAARQVLTGLADESFDGLRACAGVAIVKHHFPFSVAYTLAEDLCQEAKSAIRASGGSALDFHAVMDASPPDLKSIRASLKDPAGRLLTRRPYGVGQLPANATVPHFSDLAKAARLMVQKEEDSDDRLLPNGPLHDLRQALFVGLAHEAHTTKVMQARLPSEAARTALADLYKALGSTNASPRDPDGRTGFIDALDHQQFLKGSA